MPAVATAAVNKLIFANLVMELLNLETPE